MGSEAALLHPAAASSAQFALSVRDISVRFSGLLACSSVSFDIAPGETLAIIGPNGAGKTTLVNALTGAVKFEPGGSVRLASANGPVDISRLRPDQIVKLGLVRTFQNVLLVPHLTVRENVLLGRYVHQSSGILGTMIGLPAARSEQRRHAELVDAILEELGLTRVAGQVVSELAYGVRKTIELARALAMEPATILLDEPVAGMSREERSRMIEFVTAARRTRPQMAVLLIEHDMHFVMSLADRVLAINAGTVIATGTPDEIQKNPLVLEAYLGPADD